MSEVSFHVTQLEAEFHGFPILCLNAEFVLEDSFKFDTSANSPATLKHTLSWSLESLGRRTAKIGDLCLCAVNQQSRFDVIHLCVDPRIACTE